MSVPLDQQAAAETLEPVLATLRECIEAAWSEWKTSYAPQHTILDARARAAIVNCHIIHQAKTRFTNNPDVKVGTANGVFRLFIGGDIALRFKKARKDGTTSNISTRQQQLIDLQLTIPGLLPGTMLNAVYRLDNLQQDINDMMVTLQVNRRLKWAIPLATEATAPTVMPTPVQQTVPRQRARVKGTVAEQLSIAE